MARSCALSTSHHLATEAGNTMFEAGGNAIDAAVAAAAVLTVVYPHNTSIGGDLTALVARGKDEPELIDAFGYAPAAVDPSLWGTTGRVNARGPQSITIPGAVKGWKHLLDTYGTLPLATILAPAIAHSGGYRIGRSVRTLIDDVSASSDAGQALMISLFGEDYQSATHTANPALGRTLGLLAENGLDDFYTGQVADQVTAFLSSIRPDITGADLAEYQVKSLPSLSTEFSGYRIHTAGAPSQGFALLRFLRDLRNHLSSENLEAMTDEALASMWLDSFARSDAIRDSVLAEDVDDDVLLAERPDPEAISSGPSPAAGGDTIGLAASDGELTVSLIQSLYSSFGSLCHDPETGILFQNRGSMFSLDPNSPQVVTPHRRPPHTLMPVLVRRPTGEPALIQSTMGGKAQAQIHARLLIHLLRGKSPSEATAHPRWSSAVAGQGRAVTIEDDASPQAKEILSHEQGDTVREVPPLTDGLGHANVIDLRSDPPLAASDPRSDGSAFVRDWA